MVFCNYQDSLSISKFTLPGRNDPLNCCYARTFHWSFHVRMNGFAALQTASMLVIFRICLLISLTSGFDNAVYRKTAFSVKIDWFFILCCKIQIHWPLINQIKHKTWKPLNNLSLSLAFQNLIVPSALDTAIYNEWEHYKFSPLFNDTSVLCKLKNTVVTIWWAANIKYTSTGSLKPFIGHR